MSTALRRSTGSIGTVGNVTRFSEELDILLGGQTHPALVATDEFVEDPTVLRAGTT